LVIRISPRANDSLICPYCHDELQGGVRCPDCRTGYHEECAAVFARCAIRGCKGRLGVVAEGVVLPRLAHLARRIDRWSLEEEWENGPIAIALMMSDYVRRDNPEASRAVAEILGQTPFDARMRLGAAYPELLVHHSSIDEARLAVVKLQGLGLAALAIPLAELIRPLATIRPSHCERGSGGWIFRSQGGGVTELPMATPRLLVDAQFLRVSRLGTLTTKRIPSSRGASRSSKVRSRTTKREKRQHEPVTFLFRGDDPLPIELGPSVVADLSAPTLALQRDRLRALRAQLASGASERALEGTRARGLLTRNFSAVCRLTEEREDNLPAVRLCARLIHYQWVSEGQGKGGKAARK